MPYIGNINTSGGSTPILANNKYATRFQAGSSFTAITMSCAFSGAIGAGEYAKLAIYSDNSGSPDTLLGVTNEIEGISISIAPAWYTGGLASSVSIINGNYYWLALLGDNTGSAYDSDAISSSETNADTYSDGFADPFGSSTSGTVEYSIIASTGFVGNLSKGGAVLEASGGTKVAVFVNGETIEVWKDIDGTPSLVDSDVQTVVHGAAGFGWIDAAIDSNDDIHVVSSCTTEQTRDVAYAVCDLTTGFGTWEQAADYTEQAPTNPGCAISIDSNDYPHILFVDNVKVAGSAQDNVYYDYNDGSWSGAEQVGVRDVKTYIHWEPQISHAPSDDVEAIYKGTSTSKLTWRRRNGTWGTETAYTNPDIVGSVVVTTGDAAYRYGADLPGDIYENNVDVGYNTDTVQRVVSASLVGTDRYIFYIDTSDDVHVISNDGGGWTDESAQQTGTYLRVIAEWAYNNENQSGEINYIFDDGTNVYYDAFSLATTTQVYKDTQLKWDMREFVYDDIQIKWDIFDLVYKDLQSVWDIFDTVYKDLQAVWDMRELVYQDIQAVWDMSGAVSKDLQAVWDIFDTVYKDTELKWDILDLVGRELQSVWDIFVLVGKETQAKWDIRELVGDELQVVWDIFDTVYQDTQIVWDIFDTVYQDVQAKWDILTLIGKELQAKWDIRELVYQDIELVWDILSGAAQVFKDMQIKWDIRELVGKNIQSVWDIFDVVYQDIQAKWDVLNLVNKSIEAKYDIRELVGRELQSVWDILNLVGQEVQAKWDISILVTKSIEAKWDILNLVNNSINAIWDVHELVGRSLVARWDILNGAPPEEGGGKVSLRQTAYRWTRKVGR